jgi:hypothetical protein
LAADPPSEKQHSLLTLPPSGGATKNAGGNLLVEMGSDQLIDRMLAAQSGVDAGGCAPDGSNQEMA